MPWRRCTRFREGLHKARFFRIAAKWISVWPSIARFPAARRAKSAKDLRPLSSSRIADRAAGRTNFFGPEFFHLPHHLAAEGMPVAHDGEAARIRAEDLLQRARLRLGVLEDGRAPADFRVNLLRDFRAAPRDKAREDLPERRGHAQDSRVAEQIVQKRTRRPRARPARRG